MFARCTIAELHASSFVVCGCRRNVHRPLRRAGLLSRLHVCSLLDLWQVEIADVREDHIASGVPNPQGAV